MIKPSEWLADIDEEDGSFVGVVLLISLIRAAGLHQNPGRTVEWHRLHSITATHTTRLVNTEVSGIDVVSTLLNPVRNFDISIPMHLRRAAQRT